MSSFNRKIWEQATLAMAEEYLDKEIKEIDSSIPVSSVLSVKETLCNKDEMKAIIFQTPFLTQMQIHLESELNIMMENLA